MSKNNKNRLRTVIFFVLRSREQSDSKIMRIPKLISRLVASLLARSIVRYSLGEGRDHLGFK